jgi:hypothetical protein
MEYGRSRLKHSDLRRAREGTGQLRDVLLVARNAMGRVHYYSGFLHLHHGQTGTEQLRDALLAMHSAVAFDHLHLCLPYMSHSREGAEQHQDVPPSTPNATQSYSSGSRHLRILKSQTVQSRHVPMQMPQVMGGASEGRHSRLSHTGWWKRTTMRCYNTESNNAMSSRGSVKEFWGGGIHLDCTRKPSVQNSVFLDQGEVG